jgi:hypothetical protein
MTIDEKTRAIIDLYLRGLGWSALAIGGLGNLVAYVLGLGWAVYAFFLSIDVVGVVLLLTPWMAWLMDRTRLARGDVAARKTSGGPT